VESIIIPAKTEALRCVVEALSWRFKRLAAASTTSAGPLAGMMIKTDANEGK
jgi:hypothetical protein